MLIFLLLFVLRIIAVLKYIKHLKIALFFGSWPNCHKRMTLRKGYILLVFFLSDILSNVIV